MVRRRRFTEGVTFKQWKFDYRSSSVIFGC
jgi:hypothetical protein